MIRIFPRYKKTKNILFLLTGFITFGLFYDALMLALGGVMEGGGLLLALSRLRFVSHGALIPLIFLICAYALNLKGIPLKAVWVLTGVLVVLGIAEGFAVELTLSEVAGSAATPPAMTPLRGRKLSAVCCPMERSSH